MFHDLIDGNGESNVQLSVMGGPPGAEQPIISIDIPGGSESFLQNCCIQMLNVYTGGGTSARRSGNRAQPAGAVSQHSLLVDNAEVTRIGRDTFAGASRHRHRPRGPVGSEYNEWVQSLEDMIGAGAGQLMQQVFGNIQGGGASMPQNADIGTDGAAQGGPLVSLQNLLSGLEGRHDRSSRHRSTHRDGSAENPANAEAQLVNEAISNPPLIPYSTVDRWNEESAIFSGGVQASERITLISRRVTAALMPDKTERDKEEREKEEREKEEREKVERERIEQTKGEEEPRVQGTEAEATREAQPSADGPPPLVNLQAAQTAPPAAETDLQEGPASESASLSTPASSSGTATISDRPSWRERVERRRQAQNSAQVARQQSPSVSASRTPVPTIVQSIPDDLTEVLSLAERLSAVEATPTPLAFSSDTPSASMLAAAPEERPNAEREYSRSQDEPAIVRRGQAQIAPGAAPQDQPNGATSSVGDRVTIGIRGNPVDITDTGIDPEFLEALPDDMREELVML